MKAKLLAIAFAILATTNPATAESFKLGKGAYIDGHTKKCPHVKSYQWLMHVVGRDPLITCNHGNPDTMAIQSGKEPPLLADAVDKSTGWWKLDDEHKLMISLDPLAHPREPAISISILERVEGSPDCFEKWAGASVRQPEPKP